MFLGKALLRLLTAADAGLKALRLLKLSQHMEALSRENVMDFLYIVGMVRIKCCTQGSWGRESTQQALLRHGMPQFLQSCHMLGSSSLTDACWTLSDSESCV